MSLIDFLESLSAEQGGSIPFERFMAAALYDPRFGYYTANIETVGRRGDFSTSATRSEELGKAIANWIKARSSGSPVSVIELGAGEGSLARTVLDKAGWWARRRWKYRIVEISSRLREVQRERLGNSVRWADSIESALAECGGNALIFSNELVDAFPVVVAAWDGSAWQEVRVSFNRETGLREVFTPLEAGKLDSSALEQNWQVGQRIEIHDSYRRWIPKLKGGALLTIDYGGSVNEIYHRRPMGTLRGYFKHQRIEGAKIYQRFGQQDLTADVNFDDLERWGRNAGLEVRVLENQADWISRWGGAKSNLSEADTAFKILEQRPTS
ncbi:MAG: SAM-dependent MidA family methyltransferase [Verrucomicrobiales bacterium]